MDLLTSFVRVLLHYRVRAIARYADGAESIQRKTLAYLVKTAAHTLWGKEHGYETIRSYEDFATKVPAGDYASLKPYIQKMMDGEGDILWKGRITRFAISSGTTSDVHKLIPVSRRHLKHSHLRGGRDVTATYLHNNRNSRVALGESLIVSGGFRPELDRGDIRMGDIVCKTFEAHTSGSGSLGFASIDCADFTGSVKGSGNLRSDSVHCDGFGVSTSGSGDIDIESVAASGSASVKVSGSGDITLRKVAVDGDMDLKTSGSGDITVNGSCRDVTASTSGSGIISGNLSHAGMRVSTSGSGDVNL